jgi:hypothetical protein
VAITAILVIQNRGRFFKTLLSVGRFGLLAGVLLSGAGLSFIQAFAHTTIANALFIIGAIPFFAAVLARIFLGERLRRSTLVTMLFAGSGLALMVVNGISMGSGFGNLMALATAISFAGFAVVVRYRRRVEMLPSLLIASVLIIAVSLPVTGGDLALPWNDILLCLFWGGCLSGFVTASGHRGGDAADADRIRAGPGLGVAVRRRSPEPLDTDRWQRHHHCGGGARNPRTDEQIAPRANAGAAGLRCHSAPRIILEQIGKLIIL